VNRRLGLFVSLAFVAAITTGAALTIQGWRHALVAGGTAIAGFLVGRELLRGISTRVATGGTAFDRLLVHTPRTPSRPADLESLERALGWKIYTDEEFAHRVAPLLYALARRRLEERAGVDLAREPERAPKLIRHYLLGRAPERVGTADLTAIVNEIEGI
jgi:hypothetical protein